MAHIKNRDTRVMMLVSVLLGGIVLLSDWARRSFFHSRHGRRQGSSLVIVVPALLLVLFSPLISRLLAMAVSRQREYLADATAVEFTRNPVGLAKALEKLRDAAMPFQKASRATAHLFIVNPMHRRFNDRDGKLADLLGTHPPINRRILLLYQMAGLRPGAADRQDARSQMATAHG
jgi:heat shock protein HtpX